MNLVIHGKESIEQLKKYVDAFMSEVPDRNQDAIMDIKGPMFRSDLLQKYLLIEPRKDLRSLTITWEIPYEFANLDTKPASLVSHVLGHEGEHSLLAFLKEKNLVEGLGAGKSIYGARNVIFEISVSLTPSGLENKDFIIKTIFQAIESLRQRKYPKYLFDELNYISRISYEYQQRSASMATSYCENLRREGLDSFPFRSILISEFNPQHALDLLNFMTPEKCFITVISKDIRPKDDSQKNILKSRLKKEKWMGAKYAIMDMEQRFIDSLKNCSAHPEITYPDPNPFIPDDLQIVPAKEKNVEELPVKIIDGKDTDFSDQVYFAFDSEFLVPEVCIQYHIRTPFIRPGNPRSQALTDLFLKFVNDDLTKIAYDASYAGIG